MRRLWMIGLATLSCAPQLGNTDEPELEKSMSAWEEKREALEDLDVLVDAQRPPTIGRLCSIAGVAPSGRAAVDALVTLGRADLLRRALRAPSPEGRLYAAIGLARLHKLPWADVAARASKEGDIEVCSGCLASRVPASHALSYYEDGVPVREE